MGKALSKYTKVSSKLSENNRHFNTTERTELTFVPGSNSEGIGSKYLVAEWIIMNKVKVMNFLENGIWIFFAIPTFVKMER